VREGVQEWFYESPAAQVLAEGLDGVERGLVTPTSAAAQVLECLKGQKF
jgi:hypothetical protein